ncbi:MAG: hypothetical protein K2K53_07810, partial [Oscillospiraceae bacterium]|nr:hypothetical protein [Oscillospiraceae bacterium]
VMLPNGNVLSIKKALAASELRMDFNGRNIRLCETAINIADANAISFLCEAAVQDICNVTPGNDVFIGNLRNEFVREVLESLVRDGYVDLSGLKLQKVRLMSIPSDYKFDNGESGAYLLQGYEAASCFTAVPGYPPLMGRGGAIFAVAEDAEDAEDTGEEDCDNG